MPGMEGMQGNNFQPPDMAELMEAMQNFDVEKMMKLVPPELIMQMQEMM